MIKLGSVSYGRRDSCVLIPLFLAELEKIDELAARNLWDEIPLAAHEITKHAYWQTDEANELLFQIIDKLNECGPPFVYFGVYPDSDADFGWWPDTERVRFGISEGKILATTDLREIPSNFEGVVALLSEKGHTTLMSVVPIEVAGVPGLSVDVIWESL